jgi:hypothetical protein
MMEVKKIRDCINIINSYEDQTLKNKFFRDKKDNELSMHFNSPSNFILTVKHPIKTSQETHSQNADLKNETFELISGEHIKITSSLLQRTDHLTSSEFNIYAFEKIMPHDIKNSRFRLIMKYADTLRLDHYFEDLVSIYTDLSKTNRNAIEVNIKNNEFLVYFSDGYFIVESSDVSDIDFFLESCRYILTSMSFVMGKAPGDYAYIFEYEDDYKSNHKGYKFNSSFTKPVDSSSYSHVNSNIYIHCQEMNDKEKKDFVEKYRKAFKGVSKNSFSNLCNLILTDDSFADGVYSIIEARQASLIAMGVLYSVSLESLSTAISSNETSHYIKNKYDRNELKRQLLDTASDFFSKKLDVSFDESPIKKKLENICSPTNKDKLTSAFNILSIPLLEDDHLIINKRNDFLHGNKLFLRDSDFEEQSLMLWNIALRLSFLVNAIVLKHIGHSGYINNNAKILIPNSESTQHTYREI